jgi:hypothetical protein
MNIRQLVWGLVVNHHHPLPLLSSSSNDDVGTARDATEDDEEQEQQTGTNPPNILEHPSHNNSDPCDRADCIDSRDHKDRDTADWTASLKSKRFRTMQLFHWLSDGIMHVTHTAIKAPVGSDKAHPWHECLNEHLGGCKFQMDLASDLTSRRTRSMDWLDIEDNGMKPV